MYEKLTDIFDAVAVKYLTAVDVKRKNSKSSGSNQHELGGLVSAGIGKYLDLTQNQNHLKYKATMVYIGSQDEEPIVCRDTVTWYDTRYMAHGRGPEFRLYYKTNEVSELFEESDFLLIAVTKDKELLLVFTPNESTVENQLRTIFGAGNIFANTSFKEVKIHQSELALPIQTMLSQLGIELYTEADESTELLNSILKTFGERFPKTREFSNFTRALFSDSNPMDDPDESLLRWMNGEEKLFRILERHIVAERLKKGFGEHGDDVDEFISFSLSVQNRRKSRVGHALENHIEEILLRNSVIFERGKKTEEKQTPDFLFPGQKQYLSPDFDSSLLRMLGAKTTCKERWRQVLAEAERIKLKHLLTLEPAISEDQTNQMSKMNLQLIVPENIQLTYTSHQRSGLQSFKEFIEEVKYTQKNK
ncbi:MAG: restriction endonuclease [Alteromonadaceae bacterium]|nr:restriction endonuclease [Alteromonadaceae bacterium]MAX42551.1 restriction endonuclease [Alteromonadaceae bacterium]MBL52433.1 restriction endonuclease [Alteromonadaceae bacterium]|tara:strand:+ start:44522 stop:45778 length:1257 start_codon:yes stop_codon:yes gene_type:complete